MECTPMNPNPMLIPLPSDGDNVNIVTPICDSGGLGVGGGNGGMDMLVEFMNGTGGMCNVNNLAATMPLPTGGSRSSKVSKSHSEAERRRRQRINGHLATLRTLLPNTTKMDKASLLTEVVRQVRELRRYADDAVASWPEEWSGIVPGEADEVRTERVVPTADGGLVRVSVCCEDRPGLMTEVNQAIRSVQARAVRAEMSTVGGRTKSVVMVEGEVEGEDRSVLHATLRAITQKPGPVGHGVVDNNRFRFARSIRMA